MGSDLVYMEDSLREQRRRIMERKLVPLLRRLVNEGELEGDLHIEAHDILDSLDALKIE